MKFIRIIQSANKDTNRTKRVVNKPSKSLPEGDKNTKKLTQDAPRRTLTKKTINPIKNNGTYPLQDISTSTFEELQEQGYNMVTFVAHSGACNFCKGINGRTWTLDNLLRSTQYDAPIFSHSHVNAQSEMKVWDRNGELPDIYVNYNGDTHQ